ncbi:hypothetical protein GBF38_007528, partial [Nibea albiflora]
VVVCAVLEGVWAVTEVSEAMTAVAVMVRGVEELTDKLVTEGGSSRAALSFRTSKQVHVESRRVLLLFGVSSELSENTKHSRAAERDEDKTKKMKRTKQARGRHIRVGETKRAKQMGECQEQGDKERQTQQRRGRIEENRKENDRINEKGQCGRKTVNPERT